MNQYDSAWDDAFRDRWHALMDSDATLTEDEAKTIAARETDESFYGPSRFDDVDFIDFSERNL